jgi:hypothetical protein
VVGEVQVDVVGLQPPQGRLARRGDGLRGQAAELRVLAHLGGDDDLVAVAACLERAMFPQ